MQDEYHFLLGPNGFFPFPWEYGMKRCTLSLVETRPREQTIPLSFDKKSNKI